MLADLSVAAAESVSTPLGREPWLAVNANSAGAGTERTEGGRVGGRYEDTTRHPGGLGFRCGEAPMHPAGNR